jgi:ribose 5-phosphate isomerase RpiB
VITAELLEQRADGAKRIVIGAKSILTPSARDFLNSRGLDCKRQEADGTSTSARTAARIDWKAIVVQSTPAVVAALDDAGRSTTDHWERELAGTVAEAVAFGVSVVSRAEAVGVVIFSNQAEAAACRANRNRQVRAAVVGDAQSVRRVKSQLGANLFCIAPAGKSYFELRNLLREIGGPPQVPSDWDE